MTQANQFHQEAVGLSKPPAGTFLWAPLVEDAARRGLARIAGEELIHERPLRGLHGALPAPALQWAIVIGIAWLRFDLPAPAGLASLLAVLPLYAGAHHARLGAVHWRDPTADALRSRGPRRAPEA
jgi:hypothetical protein